MKIIRLEELRRLEQKNILLERDIKKLERQVRELEIENRKLRSIEAQRRRDEESE